MLAAGDSGIGLGFLILPALPLITSSFGLANWLIKTVPPMGAASLAASLTVFSEVLEEIGLALEAVRDLRRQHALLGLLHPLSHLLGVVDHRNLPV